MVGSPLEFLENGGFLALENPALESVDSAAIVLQLPELDGHCLFRTSGTEGTPKFVALSRAALLASAGSVNRRFNVNANDRWLCALPTFHVGGFGILARAYLAGSEVEMFGRWNPFEFCEKATHSGITLTSLVPTQVFDLVVNQLKAPESLRCAIVGGGALNQEIAGRAKELGWPLVETYGMTETGSMIAAGSESETAAPKDFYLLKGWEARSCAKTGALELRGEGLFSGYVRNVKTDFFFETPIDQNGWFRTSDRVELNGEVMRFIGRMSAEVKVLGELVDLDRLQNRVAGQAEAAGLDPGQMVVMALKDERSGHKIVLVQAGMRDEGKAVLREVNGGLAGFERISELIEVEQIPRSPLGKIEIQKLRMMIEAKG